MDFSSAVKIINRLLRKLKPSRFCSSWILKHAPEVYRYIRKNVRAISGGIDWDRFTRALDRKQQRKWYLSRRGRLAESAKSSNAVELIINEYREKLYTFLSPADKGDRLVQDAISIALVRVAQQGNAAAKEELMRLLRFTLDDWIVQEPRLACWQGMEDRAFEMIEGCIRRYRYSGTFMGYLFKTLVYAGRGIRPMIACSLDDTMFDGTRRMSDIIAINGD
jgi:hypothetical protein